jgi:hypothetical protein
LLFATGHHIGEWVVDRMIQNSEHGGDVYATWRCRDWSWGSEHTEKTDTLDNVSNLRCACGLPLNKHHEIDLFLKNLMLTGHPDLVFLWRDTYYIRELKSMDRKDVDFDDLQTPLAAHRLQLSFYYKMLMAKAVKEGRTVSRRLVVDYIDRSNKKLFGGNPYKPLAMPPEKDIYLAPFKNRLLNTVQGIKTSKLPKRICPSIGCTRAKNCDLAVECFERRGTHVTSPTTPILADSRPRIKAPPKPRQVHHRD